MKLSIASMMTFNFYYDMKFWLAFILTVVIFRLLSFNERIRNTLLLFCSILMLLALPRFNVSALLIMLAISLLTFLIGYLLSASISIKEKTKRILAAFVGILSVIAILSFFKYTFIQDIIFKHASNSKGDASHFIFLIGISYSSFKMMHFIVESYKQKINGLKFLNFINYIFFFPAFISGPINRYNHFCNQLDFEKKNTLKNDLAKGMERIVHGLFKKLVLSTSVFPYAIVNMQLSISDMSAFEILLGLYAYTFYFYFDFAGYTDIAIGSARIMGIELPENFNNPFLKKNIQQFWANFHISLTSWLTDYIYWPLSRKMRKIAFFKKRPVFMSNINIIITFIVCGMWHGETFNFVVWGAYHGVGLATLNVYQKQKRKIRNSFVRNYFRSKYSEFVGIFFTLHFFVFGIILFSLKNDEIQLIIYSIFK